MVVGLVGIRPMEENNSKHSASEKAKKMTSEPEPHPPAESGGASLFGPGPQSAALLQTVLDSLTYPLYVIDVADYHVSLANRTAQESCNGGAATCYALTHRRDVPCHTEEHPCPIEIIKATGKPTVVEHVHYDAAGQPKNVEVHAFPIFDKAHRLVQIIEYCVDITERKRAQEELLRAKQEWERTFDAVPDLITIIDTEHRIVRANRAMAERLGRPPEECIGLKCHECVHDLDAPPDFCPHAKSLADGLEHTVEIHEERCGGDFLVTCTPLFDPNGRRIGSVHVARDITERKHAETALCENEERLRAIFDNAGVGLAEAAADDRFVAVNDRFCQIFGYTREELLGKTVHELTAPADRAHSDALNAQLHDGRTDRIDYEKRYLKRDGTPVWVHVTVSAIHDADGRWQRSIATVQDISQRKQMEEELRDLAATLETKVAQRTAELEHRAGQLQRLTLELSQAEDQERGRLAEILHDDLQQVLAAAKFHLGLLKARAQRDPAQQATAGQIDLMLKEAIDKSRSLSHELSPAVLRHGDFAETLRWLAGQVQSKHGLQVHVAAFGHTELQSQAIKALLYKAAQELLFNVVKHARVPQAAIRVRRFGRYLCLSVRDRGRGFDPQEIRETAGFGLLSIRERVELLGGRMKIRSAKGQGSTFLIVVPDGPESQDGRQRTVGAGPRARPTSEAEPGDHRLGGHGGPPLRVLLADDHRIVREGLLSLLSEVHDVQVVGEAANGREAINQAYRLRPDVVIMDVAMPLINGDDATRQIRRHLPHTRVIALSMYEEAEMKEMMFRAGAESYVLKTAPSEELLAAIRGSGSNS